MTSSRGRTPEIPEGFHPISDSQFDALTGPFHMASPENGRYRLGLYAEERHCNSVGIIHGGMLMTMIDETMGTAAKLASKHQCCTVSMNCDFIAPAQVDAWLECVAVPRRVGKTTVFINAELFSSNHLVMTASGVFKVLTPVTDEQLARDFIL
ncbi:MAG: PaaI family thioesterase [Endozoicomonas sp.]